MKEKVSAKVKRQIFLDCLADNFNKCYSFVYPLRMIKKIQLLTFRIPFLHLPIRITKMGL